MVRWLVALLILSSLPGCMGTDPENSDDASEPNVLAALPEGPLVAIEACGSCFEPISAWDTAGRLWVVSGNPGNLSVSEDGGRTFRSVAIPPDPYGRAIRLEQDVNIWVHGEEIWWTTMLIPDPWETRGNQIRVAQSSDQGATWDLNQVLDFDPVCTGEPCQAGSPDRPWTVVFDDAASLLLSYPNPGMGMAARATDGEFSSPAPVIGATGKFAGFGGPARSGDVSIVPFVRQWTNPGTSAGAGQLWVLRTDDAGQTWNPVAVSDAVGPEGAVGGTFPGAGHDGDRFLVPSRTFDGQIVVWSSPDGLEWVHEVAFDAPDQVLLPWAAGTSGKAAVAWYTSFDGGYRLWSALFNGSWSEPIEIATMSQLQADNPHVTLRDDGLAVFAWSERENVFVRYLPV